ncbi:MAG: hypothetical protein BGO69_09990 [Bacteroidetes bacterium 46-16]|nr:MAG: hypothetical protein BGO69_09990 [Bacteroidetes bacterium 46-16]
MFSEKIFTLLSTFKRPENVSKNYRFFQTGCKDKQPFINCKIFLQNYNKIRSPPPNSIYL